MLKKLLRIFLALIVISFAGFYFTKIQNKFDLGIKNGKFAPCPDSPNCISSFEEGNESKYLKHIQLSSLYGNEFNPMSQLKNALPNNAKIISEQGDYLHCEFKLGIWTDDVEFLVNPEQNIIHFRSSSRWGYDDLGANRKRIENLKKVLETNP